MSDELYALYQINSANNWQSFLDGVKEFTVPGQNFVYADNEGNIGYHGGVRLPKRDNQNPTLPVPGWTGMYEWKGFVPFEQLPSLYNPAQGYIATANNKTIASYPFHISNLWEPPSRIQRMEELLKSHEKISVDDFKRMQMDVMSPFAKELTPYILHAYDSVTVRDENISRALNYFSNWNFNFTKNDIPTALFHVFFQHLMHTIYADEMGEQLFGQYIYLANMPYRVTLALLASPNAEWFDDVTTPQHETRDDIIRKSMDETIHELQQKFGSEMKEWRWGKLHTLTFNHVFGSRKPLDVIFNIGPFELGGSGTTLNNGEYSFVKPYTVTLGPSTRQIVDFADVQHALSVIPTGQSGQPLHDHYSDQTQRWLNGDYHTLPIDESAVKIITRHTLELIPQH